MKTIEIAKDPTQALAKIVARFTIDPWVGMLTVGAIGHRLNVPLLYRFGFFESLLVILLIQSYSTMKTTKWVVEDD